MLPKNSAGSSRGKVEAKGSVESRTGESNRDGDGIWLVFSEETGL